MRILNPFIFYRSCKIIEQCNHRESITFYQWDSGIMGDSKDTVCIWRIKYKN